MTHQPPVRSVSEIRTFWENQSALQHRNSEKDKPLKAHPTLVKRQPQTFHRPKNPELPTSHSLENTRTPEKIKTDKAKEKIIKREKTTQSEKPLRASEKTDKSWFQKPVESDSAHSSPKKKKAVSDLNLTEITKKKEQGPKSPTTPKKTPSDKQRFTLEERRGGHSPKPLEKRRTLGTEDELDRGNRVLRFSQDKNESYSVPPTQKRTSHPRGSSESPRKNRGSIDRNIDSPKDYERPDELRKRSASGVLPITSKMTDSPKFRMSEESLSKTPSIVIDKSSKSVKKEDSKERKDNVTSPRSPSSPLSPRSPRSSPSPKSSPRREPSLHSQESFGTLIKMVANLETLDEFSEPAMSDRSERLRSSERVHKSSKVETHQKQNSNPDSDGSRSTLQDKPIKSESFLSLASLVQDLPTFETTAPEPKPEKPLEKIEKSEKEKNDKPEKHEKIEKVEKHEKLEKAEKHEKIEKADKHEKHEKNDKEPPRRINRRGSTSHEKKRSNDATTSPTPSRVSQSRNRATSLKEKSSHNGNNNGKGGLRNSKDGPKSHSESDRNSQEEVLPYQKQIHNISQAWELFCSQMSSFQQDQLEEAQRIIQYQNMKESAEFKKLKIEYRQKKADYQEANTDLQQLQQKIESQELSIEQLKRENQNLQFQLLGMQIDLLKG